MKQFSCGDVVPGCKVSFEARDEPSLFGQIAAHARADHGLTEISPALLAQVRAKIRDVSATV